jgi:hypothetical protein
MNTIALKALQHMAKIIPVFWLLCLSLTGYSQFREIVSREKPFKFGEIINYYVKFGPIIGGHATLLLNQSYYDNRMVYYARGEGKTVGLAEKLYSVKDIFESYFDLNTLLPYKAIRDVKEGNYRKHDEAIFHQTENTVYCVRKDTLFSVPAGTLDMVSVLFYLRSLDLQNLSSGTVLHPVTFFNEALFPFDIRYKGKELVKTKFGKIKCFRFDPVVEPGRMFASEDDMIIWISDDLNRIPVKVRFDLLVGSLHMELSEYTNLKFPLGILPD